MNALLAGATVLAHLIVSQPPELTTQEALKKFDATCAGKKSTPACDQLRWQLEYALYEDLIFLARTTGELDDAILRIGAAADVPQLKAFCLDRIHDRGLQAAEHPLVIAALNDPYPLVRASAQKMVGELPDEKHSRMLSREARSDRGDPATTVFGLIGGSLPDAKKLGAQPYPGATYWYFASDRDSDFFTTRDAPEKVIAFYAKGNKKALTAEQLEARVEATMDAPGKDPMAVARMMQEAMARGEDPQKVIEGMAKGGDVGSVDWTRNIEGEDGVVKPRYVVLSETQFFGKPLPTGVVVIFKDEIMGGTSVVFRRQPPQPSAPAGTSQKEIERLMRRQEVLGSSDATLKN